MMKNKLITISFEGASNQNCLRCFGTGSIRTKHHDRVATYEKCTCHIKSHTMTIAELKEKIKARFIDTFPDCGRYIEADTQEVLDETIKAILPKEEIK